jgi:hypothetical protein
MTRDAIIAALFNGKNFNDCIGKMDPHWLQEDLKMEVALIVCEWPDEKVVSLHGQGSLEFYVVRVIINMMSNKYSPFYKKFREWTVEYMDDMAREFRGTELGGDNYYEEPDKRRYAKGFSLDNYSQTEIEERAIREAREDTVLAEIDNLYWYNSGLVRLYMQHGNYRAIEKETGIPYISCYKTIQKSFKQLKQIIER